MNEIVFEVFKDEADGGLVAVAKGHAIATQGDTLSELRGMVQDAVQCHFGDGLAGEAPDSIKLQFV